MITAGLVLPNIVAVRWMNVLDKGAEAIIGKKSEPSMNQTGVKRRGIGPSQVTAYQRRGTDDIGAYDLYRTFK